jgi:branched-chain amino acid transport system ATP-binding protein
MCGWRSSFRSRRWPALRWTARYHVTEAERLLDLSCGELTYGDIKRFEFAIALANNPKLLLMDEPAAGMAPRERHALMGLTAGIARDRTIGVFFTEHDMDVVFGHADRVLVLNRGTLIAKARPRRCAPTPTFRRFLSGRARSMEPIVAHSQALGRRIGRGLWPAQVLFDVALEIAPGEAFALLGRNGAGKSRTFRVILGLMARRSGTIVFDGEDISKRPVYEIVRHGLGYVPEDRIFSDLTVEENLQVGRQPPTPTLPLGRQSGSFPFSRTCPNCAGAMAHAYRAGSSRCSPSPAR